MVSPQRGGCAAGPGHIPAGWKVLYRSPGHLTMPWGGTRDQLAFPSITSHQTIRLCSRTSLAVPTVVWWGVGSSTQRSWARWCWACGKEPWARHDHRQVALGRSGWCIAENMRGGMPSRRREISLWREVIKQCLGLLEVGSVKALGEPAIHLRQQLVCLIALAQLLPEAGEAGSRTQFPRLGL
jgi:hypothetical protein